MDSTEFNAVERRALERDVAALRKRVDALEADLGNANATIDRFCRQFDIELSRRHLDKVRKRRPGKIAP